MGGDAIAINQCIGQVYRAIHRASGLEMAIKMIAVENAQSIAEIRAEVDILKLCRHAQVVGFFGSVDSPRPTPVPALSCVCRACRAALIWGVWFDGWAGVGGRMRAVGCGF